jgi:hypothetical protein
MLKPTNIQDEVLYVLNHAKKGKGASPSFLTAYQILNRLPDPKKTTLINERGVGGKKHGKWDSASKQVALACRMLQRKRLIEIAYLDTKEISITINKKIKDPSYIVCGLYRAL